MARTGAALLAAGALALGACGGGDPSAAAPAAPIAAGASALSDHAAQADTIVGSGQAAFDARLAALRGHPVVVNQWASWCSSCRFEFPFFAQAAARHEDEVAFLGLDARDDRGSAEAFQREVPAGFPSIFDADAAISRGLGGGRGWPTTMFLSGAGEVVHVKIGAYASADELERDIRRHALGEG